MLQKHMTGTIALISTFVLILDGKTATAAASEGLKLCINSVIPSLFPLFFLINIILSYSSGSVYKILRPAAAAFRMPKGSEPLMIPCFLGGYPCGAKAIHSAWQSGQLQKKEAERLLAFCNNAGPAFLLGMLNAFFPDLSYCWLLWALHIASALMTSVFFPQKQVILQFSEQKVPSVTAAMKDALSTTACVCGWVIFIRIWILMLQRWILWLFPEEMRILLSGVIELTNGCWEAASMQNIGHRFIIIAVLLGMGGCCVFLQTASVTHGLSLRYYLIGKLLHGAFSGFLAWGIVYRHASVFFACLGLCLIILRKSQKKSSIPNILGV